MAQQPGRQQQSGGGGGGKSAVYAQIWLVAIALPLVILFFPTMIVLMVGMSPTVVAFLVDRSGGYSWGSIGGLNFTGVFPYLINLWAGRQTLDKAFDILTDPYALFVMFGTAAAGWFIHLAVPPVVAAMVESMQQRHLDSLRDRQSDLVAEWGEEIVDEGRSRADQAGVPDSRGQEVATETEAAEQRSEDAAREERQQTEPSKT